MKVLLRKTSLVDYPGCVSAVLFFAGCNLRCPWCHNRELLTGTTTNLVSIEEAFAHINKRKTVLGGVVLSGGEPCLYEELPEIIGEIRKISLRDGDQPLKVKLDTNGTFPAMLGKLIQNGETAPDYIALDLKIAPFRYSELSLGDWRTNSNPGELLNQSAALIRQSSIAHEYRTIVLPGAYMTKDDVQNLAPLSDDSPWYFRPFRGGNCLDPAWDSLEEPEKEALNRAKALAEKAIEMGKNAIIPAKP